MPIDAGKQSTLTFIRRWIDVLNAIVLLIISVVLFLVLKLMYDFLAYIPSYSVTTMLSVIVVLAVAGLFAARVTSRRAIAAIEEYSDKLHGLLTTTRKVHEISHSDMLLENIMDTAIGMTHADGGSLLLGRREGDLVFKIARGEKGPSLVGRAVPKSRGIVGWAVERGRAVRVDDAKNDSRFYPEADRLTGFETGSVLCVPLRADSAAIGAIELVSGRKGAFTDEDEDLLTYFADQAAISIEKTKFHEDERNFEIHLTNILIEAIENISEKKGHAKRVAKYALLMAKALDMPESVKKQLYRASLLHDIGFIRTSASDIKGPEDYRTHSETGAALLSPINFYADIVPVIRHHHERFDGRGYPSGLAGADIPIESRIIAVAEAFDAMTSEHSYKKVGRMLGGDVLPSVVDFARAVEELRKNAGSQFDPALVEAFLKNMTAEDMA